MKITRTILILLLSVFMIGCSRNYAVNIDVKSADVLGQWSLESAPPSVSKLLGTNASLSGFTLRSNGTAMLQFFPLENFEPSAPQLGSRWSVVSQESKWGLRDWGDRGRHIWKLELETETRGIGLTVGKKASGELVLAYTPDPDKDETVLFKRLEIKRQND